MRYTTVGRTGIQVSRLCLGTMTFGTTTDDRTSKALFDHARHAGVNFFDCANSYSGGRAETMLGASMRDGRCRNDVVLISKVCRPVHAGVNGQGLSRRHIMIEVENSLWRLDTDRLDFLFVHHFDPLTPAEETLRALDDLQQQGKIVHAAASNWAAWRIARSLGISERQGFARFELLQPMYNLVKRQPEVELFPMALAENLGVIVYSPLASGLLSGLYAADRKPQAGRLTQDRYAQRYGDQSNYDVAGRFSAFAESRGFAPAALAVAWAMSHPAVTAPIAGAENIDQFDGYLAALEIPMTEELRREISDLSVAPDESLERTVD